MEQYKPSGLKITSSVFDNKFRAQYLYSFYAITKRRNSYHFIANQFFLYQKTWIIWRYKKSGYELKMDSCKQNFSLSTWKVCILLMTFSILILIRDDMNRLPYLTQCVKESLRLWSPVPTIARQISRPLTIDGITLPPHTFFNINILALHHNPEVWGEDHDVSTILAIYTVYHALLQVKFLLIFSWLCIVL